MHPLVNIAVSAARSAGNVILKHSERVETLQVDRKQHNDFVTLVDRNAEAEIIRTILKAYPDHAILGEESGSSGGDAEVRWIIDPLDGTTNFLHRIPHYAVSIGIEVRGRLEHGVIYAPCTNDLYTASRGAGAMLNSRRLRCSNTKDLDEALIGTGVPLREEFMPDYLKMLGHVATSTAGVRRAGSAALDLAYVAAGRLDGFFEFNLKPWDVAAGIVLVQEASGVIKPLAGGDDVLNHGHILAASYKLVDALESRLKPLSLGD